MNPLAREVERHLKQPVLTEAIAAALNARECTVNLQVEERLAVPEFAIKKQILSIFLPKRDEKQDLALMDVSAFILESAIMKVGLAAAFEAVEKGIVSEAALKKIERFASLYPEAQNTKKRSTAEVLYCAVSSQAAELKKLRDGLVAKIQGSGVFSCERAFQVGAENAKRFAQIRAISELLHEQPEALVGRIPLPAEVIVGLSYRMADALYRGSQELAESMANAYQVMAHNLSDGGYIKPFPAELRPREWGYAPQHTAGISAIQDESFLGISKPTPREVRNPRPPTDLTLHEAIGLVKHLNNFAALPALANSLRSQAPSELEGIYLLTEIIEHGLKLPRVLCDIRAGKESIDLSPLEAFYRSTLSLRLSSDLDGNTMYFDLIAYGGVPPPESSAAAVQQEKERVLGYINMLEILHMLRAWPADRFIREIGACETDLCITTMHGLRAGALVYENNLSWFLKNGGDKGSQDELALNDDSIATVEADLAALREAALELAPLIDLEHRESFLQEMTRATNGIREGIAQLLLRRLSNDELVERLGQLHTSSNDTGLLASSLQNASAELIQRIKAHTKATAAEAAQVLAEISSAGRLTDLVEYSAKLLKLAALEPHTEASQSLISAVVNYVGEIVPLIRECHIRALDWIKSKSDATPIAEVHVRAALEALASFNNDAQSVLCGLRDFEDLLPRHFLSQIRINLELETRELSQSLRRFPDLLGDVVLRYSIDLKSEQPEVRAGATAGISGLRLSRISALAIPEWARADFETLVRRA
jgi:hypothetical protein